MGCGRSGGDRPCLVQVGIFGTHLTLFRISPKLPEYLPRTLARVHAHQRTYPCALVEWFSAIGDDPNEDTSMWIVEPDLDIDGNHATSVIHLESIVRAAHLIPVYGEEFLPPHAVDPSNHHAHWLAF
ncbi:hypothetical protein HETIRDRAFT_168529 [Heterobasidion irregulare TC 32-1]|uniref:Uncharacterized protein n=1 Tax=Heterobasidion irregulare (strain TC 32-1) TaxID=747525 RepID=W4KHL7_HETIT|nr:uncharacterized protein HETIRDRAFT_168529 [Heterobasidion irregulare TC 32-1]ETW85214.1 hypothetical protein HETIRDRAFT_168529 [Heterobasidion irregulare TC 32-1]